MFSTLHPKPIVLECCAPTLKIAFPCGGCCGGGAGTVTLANGAVVDLQCLGVILSEFCPELACPRTIILG